MVHHIRGKHKGKAFVIEEIGVDQLKLSSMVEDKMDTLEDRESVQIDIENDNIFEGMLTHRHYNVHVGTAFDLTSARALISDHPVLSSFFFFFLNQKSP